MNEEMNKAHIMASFMWHVIEFELGTKEVIGMFWTEEWYDHICVLDNNFSCYVEIPSKTGNKKLP